MDYEIISEYPDNRRGRQTRRYYHSDCREVYVYRHRNLEKKRDGDNRRVNIRILRHCGVIRHHGGRGDHNREHGDERLPLRCSHLRD
jgi:hypothetical protein